MTKRLIYQTDKSIMSTNPEVFVMKEMAESLLKVVDFEYEGKKVKIDGFRLKNLKHWLIQSDSFGIVYQDLARLCDLECTFCYLRQNPPGIALEKAAKFVTREEMDTKLKYYDPVNKMQLFPLGYELNETLMDPKAVDIFRQIRAKEKDKVIVVRTHGSGLTEEKIKQLAELKPLGLIISLNSSDPKVRFDVMGDRRGDIAIKSLELMQKYEIPYVCGVTIWPTVDVDDLERTLRFADQFDPALFRVIMPGYSKYFDNIAFDRESVWKKYTERARACRAFIKAPIVIIPSIYEEVTYYPQSSFNQCRILGVIRNSPAKYAGLEEGDVIKEINGKKVGDRNEVRGFLAQMDNKHVARLTLKIKRGTKDLKIILKDTGKAYPYVNNMSEFMDYPYGIILSHGPGQRDLKNLQDIIMESNAKNVVLISSLLMKPLVDALIDKNARYRNYFRKKVKMDVLVPESHFLGGNIIIGDMMTVSDHILCIEKHLKKRKKMDLIVIPSSGFNSWGFDLAGVPYMEIARRFDVPVKLLPVPTVTY